MPLGKLPADQCTTAPEHQTVRRVLVVDDSRLQRRILSALLLRWGYEVVEAVGAEQALECCIADPPDFIVSDWMMPGMTGPEFCQKFRELEREGYGYFILLTSKSHKTEIAQGLDAGADDFLTKPVNADELRARMSAGERIIRMQQELMDKNRLITSALDEIKTLYDSLDNDLVEAKKLQQSLVRERFRSFGTSQVSLLLRSSGHVGGDLVGFFPINARLLGLYSIDVSGHGVASALMTARLAGYFSPTSAEQNVALYEGEFGIYDAHPPAEVAANMNMLTLTEMETESYFTMLLAYVDLITGDMTMVQAGHPHPAIQRADGSVEFIGAGGMPVGLIPDIEYDQFSAKLNPGDRLFLTSDGVTECEDGAGKMLDEDGLAGLLQRNQSTTGSAFMEALTWDLSAYAGTEDFADDVSAVLWEFQGPKELDE